MKALTLGLYTSMRARQAFTRSVDVTVPARSRAEASASVSPASASEAVPGDAAAAFDAAGVPVCAGAGAAIAMRAPVAAPRTEKVNSRRERGGIDVLGI